MTNHSTAMHETHDQFLPELACPHDLGRLKSVGDSLICDTHHKWPLRNGIPRLVEEQSEYTQAFGLQWNRFRRTQLDSYSGTTITLDRLKRCLGFTCWQRLNDPECQVLEAGCGAGRFTEILLGHTRCRLTSVDQSAAVDANQANFPQDNRHRVVQADIRSAPFPPQGFDIVLCLGVIQHTPDPEATIGYLYRQVKPGGHLVIDHYTDDGTSWIGLATTPARAFRQIMKRLPPERSLRWNQRIVDLFFPLHRMTRKNHLGRRLLSRVSPVLTYFDTFPELDDRMQREWALLDTYDRLTDYYKHKRSREEIQAILDSLGAIDIECWHGGNGVEARCRKPVH